MKEMNGHQQLQSQTSALAPTAAGEPTLLQVGYT